MAYVAILKCRQYQAAAYVAAKSLFFKPIEKRMASIAAASRRRQVMAWRRTARRRLCLIAHQDPRTGEPNSAKHDRLRGASMLAKTESDVAKNCGIMWLVI